MCQTSQPQTHPRSHLPSAVRSEQLGVGGLQELSSQNIQFWLRNRIKGGKTIKKSRAILQTKQFRVCPYLPLLIIQEFVLKNKQYQQTFTPRSNILYIFLAHILSSPNKDTNQRHKKVNIATKSSHFSRVKEIYFVFAKQHRN